MDSPHDGEVSYGDLGPGSYDTQEHTWCFPRSNGDDTRFYIVGQHRIFPASRSHEHEDVNLQSLSERLSSSLFRVNRTNALLSTFPELIPGATILPQLEQISQAINDVASINDALTSDYLAYGVVNQQDYSTTKHLHPRRILASTTGTAKHVVRLSLIEEAKYMIEQAPRSLAFMIDQYHGQHSAFWRGQDRSTIQQICFSNNNTNGNFLGVRRHVTLEILRPIVRKKFVYAEKLRVSEIGTGENPEISRIDPNWLLNISLNDTNNLPILQFAFHPDRSRELAVFNAHYQLVLLRIEAPETAHKAWTVSQLMKISLSPDVLDSMANNAWTSIAWSPDRKSILVAQQDVLFVNDLSEPMAPSIRLLQNTRKNKLCTLDVQHDGRKNGLLFVLTTIHIVILTQPAESAKSTEHLRAPLKTLLSVVHHRDPMDMSLRLSVGNCNPYIFVLIYSRLVPLVTGYKIVLTGDGNTFKHITDPFQFIPTIIVPNDHQGYARADLVNDKGFLCLKMRTISTESTGNEQSRDRHLLSILTLDSDLEVLQTIVDAHSSKSSSRSMVPASPARQSPREVQGSSSEQSDFVVDDQDSLDDKSNYVATINQHLHRRERRRLRHAKTFTFLANQINSSPSTSRMELLPLESLGTALESALKDRESMDLVVHTLRELLPDLLPEDTIDNVSSEVAKLLGILQDFSDNTQSSINSGSGFENVQSRFVSHILITDQALKDLQDDNDSGNMTFAPIYEGLSRLYLQNLPLESPPSIKIWLESIVKQAAMQLFLASRGIQAFSAQTLGPADDTKMSISEPMESPQFLLPVRNRSINPTMGGYDRPIDNIEALHTAPQSRSSESGDALSSQRTVRNEVNSEKLVGTTLSRYIQSQSDSRLHRSLRRAVPEWQIGVTPSGQEWRSALRSASQESLASTNRGRRKKKDKGKGSAKELYTSSLYMRDSDSFGTLDTIKQESRQDTALDLDSYRRDSRVLLPASSQALARTLERAQTAPLSSQALPLHNTQAISQDLSSQRTQPRLSQKPQSRKRPSGFR